MAMLSGLCTFREGFGCKNAHLFFDRAQKLLGYRPRTNEVREGLKHVHEWFVVNWDDLERAVFNLSSFRSL
jgi:hypothetical protein